MRAAVRQAILLSSAAVAFADSGTDGTDAATYTFSTKSFGAPRASRKLVVGTFSRIAAAAATVTSMTIGGIPASLLSRQINNPGNATTVELWLAHVPSGPTGDIVVNWSATVLRCAVIILATYNLKSGLAVETFGSTSDPTSIGITLPPGGIAIGAAAAGSATSYTWTGLVEDADVTIETGNLSGASLAYRGAPGAAVTVVSDVATATEPATTVAVLR